MHGVATKTDGLKFMLIVLDVIVAFPLLSDVIDTVPLYTPRFVLAFAADVAPVPPWPTATVPVTLAALPVQEPEEPVTLIPQVPLAPLPVLVGQ